MPLLWRHVGGAESPVVEKTFRQRHSVKSAQLSLLWAVINLLMALLFYMEIAYGSLIESVIFCHPIIWYCECALTILFSVNVVRDVIRYVYLGLVVSANPIELTDYQMQQLAVRKSEQGFRSPIASSQQSCTTNTTPTTPIYSPSNFMALQHSFNTTSPYPSFHLTPGHSPSPYTMPGHYSPSYSPGMTPPHHTPSPHAQYGKDRSGGSPGHLGGSFIDQSTSYGMGHNSSLSVSMSGAPSPFTPNLSSLFREDSLGGSPQNTSMGYGLRSRIAPSPGLTGQTSPQVAPPGGNEGCISDLKALDVLLKEEREKEIQAQLVANESSPGGSGGPSFWRFNRSFSDYTPILRKYQYQIACRSPTSSKSAAKDDDVDESTKYTPDEVWRRVGVGVDITERWVENLRKWLRETILVRVVKEIKSANNQLARCGCEDMQIGEVSISHLKQLALTKSQQVPHLNELIPFLEATHNQEYLVTRIREIAAGGCMSDFNWNGGNSFKGKPWGEHLPSDCAILMHLFCTYMDCRLPPNPKSPDGKTFTNQYFLKTPDKPNVSKKDNLCIYQSSINPPHFKVILQDDIWNPRKGRNNMFHAILLFLHHVKEHEKHMLGRVNLGLSGINVLWVLEH